eukprot:CAMPEP_0113587738 /NCGR_PEP_ID=MMETSP0015_2-20120614/35083_1 /TAXON_ID=2838 /ORGANISM="Odontella" /LENGTH=52 /DNA_ID=CAMNT_0000493447 /DNA_START=77 /DNA_END=232 /DNA_ORIENTATION=+ /assembly_acc=CAM_ASM_000160
MSNNHKMSEVHERNEPLTPPPPPPPRADGSSGEGSNGSFHAGNDHPKKPGKG